MPVVDPDIVRALGVGQAAYVYQGGVTYVQVKRLVAAPAALAPGPVRARPPEVPRPRAAGDTVPVPAAAPAQARAPLADVGVFLDEAFGPAAR